VGEDQPNFFHLKIGLEFLFGQVQQAALVRPCADIFSVHEVERIRVLPVKKDMVGRFKRGERGKSDLPVLFGRGASFPEFDEDRLFFV